MDAPAAAGLPPQDYNDGRSEQDAGDASQLEYSPDPPATVLKGDKNKTGDKVDTSGAATTGNETAGIATISTGNDTTADTGAPMAAAYVNSKPPPNTGPTGVRLWKAEVSVY